jgi:hypothetical protein
MTTMTALVPDDEDDGKTEIEGNKKLIHLI